MYCDIINIGLVAITWKGDIGNVGLLAITWKGDIGNVKLVRGIVSLHVVFVSDNAISRFLSEAG
jgi:hypothetical protein